VRAVLLPQKRTVELAGRHRVSDLLAALQITPGTVMVIRNDMLLTEDEIVGADEEVEIRSVISGGAPDHPKDPRSR
jgi:sulfur carrier protein ThiS